MPDYFTDWGPSAGPSRCRDHAIPVNDAPGPNANMIGLAFPVAWAPGVHGPITVFRFHIGGRFMPGCYMCKSQRFVPYNGPLGGSIGRSWIADRDRFRRS